METELPCRARRLTVAADAGLEVEVVCPFDWVRFTLRLAEEWDGGLLACFEVGGVGRRHDGVRGGRRLPRAAHPEAMVADHELRPDPAVRRVP
ncbi:hypothetical protein ABZ907_44750 [Nonomuraea wenchangensis]